MRVAPYRASDVREGVALPRRHLRAFFAAIVVPLAVAAAVVAAWAPRAADGITPLAAFMSLALLGAFASRVVAGRSRRAALLLVAPVVPIAMVEAWAVFVPFGFRSPAFDAAADALLPAMFGRVALARTYAFGAAASLFVLAAVACAGAVLAVDVRRIRSAAEPSRPSLAPSAIAIAVAVGLVVLRVRSIHREALLGTIAIALVVLAATLSPLLARRLSTLRSWHDDEEAAGVRASAVSAVVALALAAMCVEIALLRRDEHAALAALVAGDTGIDVRLEHAEALASAWSWHPWAAAIASTAVLAMLVPILRVPRSGARVHRDPALVAAVLLVTIVVASANAWLQRDAFRAPPDDDAALPLPSVLTLAPAPFVPDAAAPERVVVAKDGHVAMSPASAHSFELVVDRRTSTRAVMRALDSAYAVRRASQGALLVEAASKDAVWRLGRAAALVGPRLVPVPIEIADEHAAARFARGDAGAVLLVLSEGPFGRAAVRRRSSTPRVSGITFRPDAEARAVRRLGAAANAGIGVALVAVDPMGDAQALAETISAVRDVAPFARIVLTNERDTVEQALAP